MYFIYHCYYCIMYTMLCYLNFEYFLKNMFLNGVEERLWNHRQLKDKGLPSKAVVWINGIQNGESWKLTTLVVFYTPVLLISFPISPSQKALRSGVHVSNLRILLKYNTTYNNLIGGLRQRKAQFSGVS